MKRTSKIIFWKSALKIWIMRNLTLEGKIIIFKTLAISKTIHLASVTVLLNSTITQLKKYIQYLFGIIKDQKSKKKL